MPKSETIPRLSPEWRNWQTRWIQNPFWFTPSEGSSPSSGTLKNHLPCEGGFFIARFYGSTGWSIACLTQVCRVTFGGNCQLVAFDRVFQSPRAYLPASMTRHLTDKALIDPRFIFFDSRHADLSDFNDLGLIAHMQ